MTMKPPPMALSVQVSRDLLGGLAPLELNTTTGRSYRIAPGGVGPGAATWRRETVVSPVVDGRLLLGAVLDVQTLTVKVRVRASSYGVLEDRVRAVLHAFYQRSYSLTVTLGGEQRAWLCEPADSAVGQAGQYDEDDYRGLQQVVTFSVPRSPIALAGGY